MESNNKIKYLNIFLLFLLIGVAGYYFFVFREAEVKKSILKSRYVEINLEDCKNRVEIKKEHKEEDINIEKKDNIKKLDEADGINENTEKKLDTGTNKEKKEKELIDKVEEGLEEKRDEPRKENNDNEQCQ